MEEQGSNYLLALRIFQSESNLLQNRTAKKTAKMRSKSVEDKGKPKT